MGRIRFRSSDFDGHWLALRKFPTEFGRSLLKHMMERESALLDNVIDTNIYLDPRFQKILSKQRKECAVSFPKSLHLRINGLENPAIEQSPMTISEFKRLEQAICD